ncbi:MAG TPA: PRC-barrel domain-containing protein [Terriglobales bacterium]|nr:PRC-barrel domain-containing protein [Terriglobales bacterium]
MPFYSTLRDYHFQDENDDIRGTCVFDRSGQQELGSVHDVVIDVDDCEIAYVVVRSGKREVLLPADRVHLWGESLVADVRKDEFDSLLDFDDQVLDNSEQWDAYRDLYAEAFMKIGQRPSLAPVEVPGKASPPTLDQDPWQQLARAIRLDRSEILRREGEIRNRLGPILARDK